MATIVHKPNAFVKSDYPYGPPRKRSEARLKRYSSVTDSRIWAQHAFQKKACMIDLITDETKEKKKRPGKFIPVDTICTIMLAGKKDYISSLQNQIRCFVDLLLGLDLSRSQIMKMKTLCATNFNCIRDLLTDVLIVNGDNDKYIQAKPKTMSTLSETRIITNTMSTITTGRELRDSASITDIKIYLDKSNGTIPRSMSHVSLQVVLSPYEMMDKCISAKLHSSSHTLRTKSKTGRNSKSSISTSASVKATVDNSQMTKSHSVSNVHKSEVELVVDAKLHKSCVTFNDISTIDSFSTCITPSMGFSHGKAFAKPELFDASSLIEAILRDERPSAVSTDKVEVISECDQTSMCSTRNANSSIIQLYRSSKKSSIESTNIKPTSDLFNPMPGDLFNTYPCSDSKVEVAISNPELSKACMVDNSCNPNVKVTQSVNCSTCEKDFEREDLSQVYLNDSDAEDDDDDLFVDCGLQFMEANNELCCKETRVSLSRINVKQLVEKDSKHETKEGKLSESKLEQHRLLAKRAIWQLELIRQTLFDNADIICKIDVRKILQNIKNSNKYSGDVENLERHLSKICRKEDGDSCKILNEHLELLKKYFKRLVDEGDGDTSNDNPRLSNRMSCPCLMNTSHSIVVAIPSNIEISEKKRYQQQIEYFKSKLVNLDLLSLETKMLKETILKLEKELNLYDNIKSEFISFNSSGAEEGATVDTETIQMQIWELKRKAILCDQLQKQVEIERRNVTKLKQDLTTLSTQKCNDYDSLRYRAQETEIIRLERDRLKVQNSELQKLQADVINLRNKCTALECSEQRNINDDYILEDLKFVKQQAEEIEKLQTERKSLLKAIIIKECELVDQEEQIERLVTHVDRLTTDNELQQEKSKKLVTELRVDLESKQKYIDRMDNDLEWVEEKLKESISTLSKDSSQWQSKLAKLECCCIKYKTKNDTMQDTIKNLQKQLQFQQELNQNYLIELKQKNAILQDLSVGENSHNFDKKIRNVNRMESILKKSHNAVRRVVEELAKQYGCDIGIRDVVPEIINNS